MNTSQILSLASVMLFAPLVHQYLLTEGKQLLLEEKALVMSYVSYGYSILLVFVISIVVRLFYFVRTVGWLIRLHTALMILCIMMIIIGIAMVVSSKSPSSVRFLFSLSSLGKK